MAVESSEGPEVSSHPGYMWFLFRNRSFALLVGGQGLSRIGNGIYEVALGLTVYRVTGSAADMGIVLASGWLPQTLLIVGGGIIGDRLSRRVIIICADAVSCAGTALLTVAAATGQLSLPILVIASLLLGTAGAFYAPSYPALLREVIQDTDLLQPANVIDNMLLQFGTVAGPLAGGLLFATIGSEGTFALDAASFAIGIVATALIRTTRQAAPERTSVLKEAREAVAYVRETGWITSLIVLSFIANALAIAPYFVVLPLIIREAHLQAFILGGTFAAQGAAGILAGITLGRWKKPRRRGVIFLAAIGTCAIALLMLAITQSAAVIIAAGAVYGCGIAAWAIVEATLLQTYVPGHLISRVFSLDQVGSFALLPIAFVVMGSVIMTFGKSSVLLAAGAALLLSVILVSIRSGKLTAVD